MQWEREWERLLRNRLKDSQVRAATKPGRLADGDGLYLLTSKAGGKSWVFMFTRVGKRREMGLGGLEGIAPVSLARARVKADELRSILAAGQDPFIEFSERKATIAAVTFGQVADQYLDAMRGTWANEKHAAQWQMTLSEYAKPIRGLSVAAIDTVAILKVLKPLWADKQETASRLRGRIEKVLDHAKVKGLRDGENPARWKGHLDHILPARKKLQRGHHKAMDYKDMPAFMARLADAEGFGARALEFTILTGVRTGESLGAKWDEIDMEGRVWTVPAVRMKAKREHRVPLCDAALAVLEHMAANRLGPFVFALNAKKNLSNMSMVSVLKRLEVPVTVHGFRSSFRDWAGEATSFPSEIAEQALAHVVGDATERAYRRGDALERRRELMAAWAAHCYPRSNVVELRGVR